MSEARTAVVRPQGGAGLRRTAAFALLSLMLGACSSANLPTLTDAPLAPQPEKQKLLSASEQREHLRILAAYGGVYREPRVQDMLEKTVDKLVAASERPDLKYEVTILNSPAVNAFALPNGQLYVSRGLIALANDNSELASVLAHEMAHVIARHAAIREDQARQAALVNRVATDLLSDPQLGALALAKSKIALANFSRAQEFEADGIGVGISARAGYDPYGAERFLTAMGQNAHLRAQQRQHRPACAGLPVVASGDAGARHQRGRQRAPVHRPGRRPAREERVSHQPRRHRVRRGPERGLRARAEIPASEARLHLHGAGRLRARQHRAGGVRRQRQRRAGAAPRRRPRAGRAGPAGVSQLRLDREHRHQVGRGDDGRRLPGGDRDRQRRPVDVPALRGAVRQRGLPHHLRGEEPHRGGGQELPRLARHVPPHDAPARSPRRSRCG